MFFLDTIFVGTTYIQRRARQTCFHIKVDGCRRWAGGSAGFPSSGPSAVPVIEGRVIVPKRQVEARRDEVMSEIDTNDHASCVSRWLVIFGNWF